MVTGRLHQTDAKQDDVSATVFVARQPIFDRAKEVFAYELLFRSGLENYYNALQPDRATVDVIANSFFVIGFDKLTGGKKGFINFTRDLLTQGVAELVPQDAVTVEILEDVPPDDEVLAACRKLKTAGYVLAMDDFVLAHQDSPLLDYADIVKVDFLQCTPEQRETICRDLLARKVTVLAEKVETVADFDQGLALGCSLFQGYFFSKPVVQTGRRISGNKLTYLHVLQEVNRPGISYDDLEAAIKQDLSLTYKLLRFMNSAWFGFRSEIVSIKHALVLLGPKEIKKWFSLIALSHLAGDKPHELVLRAIARAKAAERVGPLVDLGEKTSELFLMGMFSLIDALTDSSMSDVLAKLPLNQEIKNALLGTDGRMREVLELIVSYEAGDWGRFAAGAASLRVDEAVFPHLFRESLDWANEACALM